MARVSGAVLLALLLVLASAIAPRSAAADSRVQFLADRLKNDDVRVRTSAALALGNSNDDAAVSPLCGAVGDSSDVVRKAVAAALERLKRSSSLSCLRARASQEPVAAVKLQIQRAIDSIEASSGGGGGGNANGGGSIPSGAKYYVSISPLNTGETSRDKSSLDGVVQGAIRSRLQQIGGYAIAPANESVSAAKTAISKHNLKGYYLAVSMEKFDYSNGGLRVQLRVAVFSYPDKDLKGELRKGASISGARPGDTSSEDQLINAVAGAVADSFTQAFK